MAMEGGCDYGVLVDDSNDGIHIPFALIACAGRAAAMSAAEAVYRTMEVDECMCEPTGFCLTQVSIQPAYYLRD